MSTEFSFKSRIVCMLVLFGGLIMQGGIASAQLSEMQVEVSEHTAAVTQHAKVRVQSTITNLNFTSDRGILRSEQKSDGEWDLTLEAGMQRLTISADGFLSFNVPRQNYGERKAYICDVRIKVGVSVSDLDAETHEVLFQLNTDNVYCSMQHLAANLVQGEIAIFKVATGEYTFHFEKNGYQPLTKTLRISSDTNETIILQVDNGRQAAYQPPGFLRLESDPTGAEVVLNGQKVGTTPYTGIIVPGEHQLELSKSMYYNSVSTFTVASGETNHLPTEKLRPRFGYAEVISNPVGASIFVSGRSVGTAGLTETLESGEYVLQARMDLYHDYEQVFTISDEETTRLEFSLRPAFGSLLVESIPESGAEVFLDGTRVGETPFTDEQIASGQHRLRVTKSHFDPVEEMITVEAHQEVRRTMILNRNEYLLNIKTDGATVYLNDREIGSGDIAYWLIPGTYKVSARKPKHYNHEENVRMIVGQDLDLVLTPQPINGSFSIRTFAEETNQPVMNARIKVNNQNVGKSPRVVTRLIGDYEVTVDHPDYLPRTLRVEVIENTNKPLDIFLQTYSGSMHQKSRRWGLAKWSSLIVTLAAGGTAVYFQAQAETAYKDYAAARSPSAAASARSDTETFDMMFQLSTGTCAAGAVMWTYSWWKQGHYRKK